MSGPSLVDQLKQKFGDVITGVNLENVDPWIEVAPTGIVDVCTLLRDEPSLAFDSTASLHFAPVDTHPCHLRAVLPVLAIS